MNFDRVKAAFLHSFIPAEISQQASSRWYSSYTRLYSLLFLSQFGRVYCSKLSIKGYLSCYFIINKHVSTNGYGVGSWDGNWPRACVINASSDSGSRIVPSWISLITLTHFSTALPINQFRVGHWLEHPRQFNSFVWLKKYHRIVIVYYSITNTGIAVFFIVTHSQVWRTENPLLQKIH